MKLLKCVDCQSSTHGGNVKRLTKLVEVRGMGFRTRVRLPSGPFLREVALLPLSKIEYEVLELGCPKSISDMALRSGGPRLGPPTICRRGLPSGPFFVT